MATNQKPTEVCISVDTEFSIAGHFTNPEKYKPQAEPVVYGECDGKQNGLGFMLETFAQHGLKATFFVECANYFYFGDEPMRSVVKQIQAAGQDVQLHVHPVWLSFNKDEKYGIFPQHDDCAGRSYGELKQAFKLCIDVFERWANKKPLAIRTGSLRADLNVYRVMRDLNIPLSSNIALGVFTPNEKSLHFNSGRHLIEGVMEVPVFTYQDMNFFGKKSKKSLQITSCGWSELKSLLWKARRSGVENIMLLTHPFEYIKKSDFQYTRVIRNRVNQGRLIRLCEFIKTHNQDFVAADFTSFGHMWSQTELDQPYIENPLIYAIARKAQNKINDTVWLY